MTTQPAPVVRRATSERSTRNAAAVMKALTQEAIDRGLDGIATSSIAKRAGLTTGAVYSRYENNDEMLIALWESVLGVRGVRLADRFLEVGGHSLLAVELLIAIEDTFGISLPIVAIMENPTAGELAAALATRGRPVAGGGPPATATG